MVVELARAVERNPRMTRFSPMYNPLCIYLQSMYTPLYLPPVYVHPFVFTSSLCTPLCIYLQSLQPDHLQLQQRVSYPVPLQVPPHFCICSTPRVLVWTSREEKALSLWHAPHLDQALQTQSRFEHLEHACTSSAPRYRTTNELSS